jgi:hypothetical protein
MIEMTKEEKERKFSKKFELRGVLIIVLWFVVNAILYGAIIVITSVDIERFPEDLLLGSSGSLFFFILFFIVPILTALIFYLIYELPDIISDLLDR